MDKDLKIVYALAAKVKECGGTAYFVGGYVRDKIRGIPCYDIDVEVHGISVETLERLIDELGKRYEVGKSFGIYKIKGYNVDIALPRKETLIGVKHQDFLIGIDPFIGLTSAARRRDFTINAIYQDILTKEYLDPFNGISDIKNKIIRCVDESKFAEDPLRVLRAAQFAARFNYSIDSNTINICKKIDLTTLSKERIFDELNKALLKSDNPSIFFNVLKDMDKLSYWFKEINDLIGVMQPLAYHKEGDVYNHTMLVLDNGVKVLDKVSNKLYFMISLLCHDLGKPQTFTCNDRVIHFFEHEKIGVDIANEFLKRITNEKGLIKYVKNMTLLHMRPNFLLYENAKAKAYYKLFDQSINPSDLILVAYVDAISSINGNNEEYDNEKLYINLNNFNILMAKDSITGIDLINYGIKTGENIKILLEYAHKLKISGLEKNEILKSTLAYAKQNNLY